MKKWYYLFPINDTADIVFLESEKQPEGWQGPFNSKSGAVQHAFERSCIISTIWTERRQKLDQMIQQRAKDRYADRSY